METYTLYPPQVRPAQVPYEVVVAGAQECHHELMDGGGQDSVMVQDGVVFVCFSCQRCGRKLCQSFDEVMPPQSWKRGRAS